MEPKSVFAEQLKQLRKQKNITQKQLAENLGTAQTTVANYESGIRFPDEKVLLKLSDFFDVAVDRMIRRNPEQRGIKAPQKPEFSYSPSGLKKRNAEFLAYALESANKAVEMLLMLRETGYTEEQILMDLIETSLIKTGTFWAEGIYNEAMEHQVSSAVLKGMDLMQSCSPIITPFRGKIASLTPGGEGHNMGLKMMGRFFELDGWENYFLGSSVPANSLKTFISDMKIDLFLVSVTLNENADSCYSMIKAVKTLENPPIVIAGGAGIKHSKNAVSAAGADHIFSSVTETVYWARDCRPIL